MFGVKSLRKFRINSVEGRTCNKNIVLQPCLYKYCAAHIGMDGMRIEKEPRQKDEYVNRTS
jgi:hypothetical protein